MSNLNQQQVPMPLSQLLLRSRPSAKLQQALRLNKNGKNLYRPHHINQRLGASQTRLMHLSRRLTHLHKAQHRPLYRSKPSIHLHKVRLRSLYLMN